MALHSSVKKLEGQLLLNGNSTEPFDGVLDSDILDGIVDLCTVHIHALEGVAVHLEATYEPFNSVGSVEIYDAVLAHDVES